MPKQPYIYLDHAAATPVDETVLAAMLPYFHLNFYNPSASYGPALQVRKAVDQARADVAYWLGCQPNELIFTAGGTEANNLAIEGIMRRYPQANVVVSNIEHESVLRPAGRFECRIAPVRPNGIIDLENLRKSIDEHTVLVSIMYANNEIGTIEPIHDIAKLISEIRKQRTTNVPLYFHTDACQATNYLDLHVARLGVDLMTLNGGKMYGPKQSGALYIKRGIALVPLINGGGQERGLRSGTENVPGIIGFAAALKQSQTMRHEESLRLKQLQSLFTQLLKQAIPAAEINGSQKHRLPSNVQVTFPGQDNERLLIALDEKGILAAAGSACSASSEEPSHVLKAIGATDDQARASLRFTMGRTTNERMIRQTIDALCMLIG